MTIKNNTIHNNVATHGGGGIYIARITSPPPYTDIWNNTIHNNQVTNGAGGGIYVRFCNNIRIIENVIGGGLGKGNSASTSGGGIYIEFTDVFQIEDNNISNNYTTDFYGGGLFITGGSPNANVFGNTIEYNSAKSGGGGIFSQGGTYIDSNNIRANTTWTVGSHGGGIWLATPHGATPAKVQNNFIHANDAQHGTGGGIYIAFGDYLHIINNTIANNKPDSPASGGGIYVASGATCIIKNTILWNNGDDFYEESAGSSLVSYCDIEDGDFGGTSGNISDNPLFVNSYYDLHITAGSPCIDTGHFGGAPPKDFDGDIRPQGAEVDIGADEFVFNTPTGSNVEVDAGSGVTVTFAEVTGAGNTTATKTTCSAAAPSGFRILPLGDPFCYDVQTTAAYSGTIEVCFAYDDTGVVDESNLKLFIHEDPPGEWADITTSIDTVNNIICGETDSLSQFAVMLEEVKPGIFDFNDGTNQGWTLQGAYDENENGPLSSNFLFGWKDYVNYPNPPGGDPSGDNNGSIQLFTMAGHGINNPGATWWIMQFHSPDLSSSSTWQTAKGYSVQIAECMAVMTSLSANLYVKVYDIDQDKDRYFYSGTAQELQHDIYGDDIANWNHLTFDWSEISAFPTNYVVKEVFVNIWGKMSGYFEGGVYFDEVIPILGKPSTPDMDGDGDADGLDLAAFASAFGSTSGDLNYNPGADFDNNGCVDESDLAVFATDFSRTNIGTVVYFADAAENPGSVYKIENGTESTYYNRTAGKLYNFAFSAEGILYYSNSNDYDLYKLEGGGETLIYHHNTYLRDVAFDSKGRIYFSESRGGGGNGYIYRLEDGVASLYYTVLLSDVGFWAGDFAFDKDDNLYLSNGNMAGANIYKVVDEVPQIVFSAPSNEPIKGISFKSAGILFYASWLGGNIYQVDLSTGERRLFYSNPDHLWLSDVFVW